MQEIYCFWAANDRFVNLRGKRIISAKKSRHNLLLSSYPAIRDGLWSQNYLIVDENERVVVFVSSDKSVALGLVRSASDAEIFQIISEKIAAKARHSEIREEHIKSVSIEAKNNSVSERRRRVFKKTEGKCFYCETQLDIAGDWHIEHKKPKCRGGSDFLHNLVASCPTCNLEKGRKTVEEFIGEAA